MKTQLKDHFSYHLNQVKKALDDDGIEAGAQDAILLRLSRTMTEKIVEKHGDKNASEIRKAISQIVYPILQPLLSKPLKEVLQNGKLP